MRISKLILPSLLAISSLAVGQTQIYRCIGSAGVLYSDFPCAAEEDQTSLGAVEKATSQADAKTVKWQAEDKKVREAVTTRFAESPVYANRLSIGMTDTQVLNLAAWGRPSQIVRSKSGRAWREQWTYKDRLTGSDRGYLFFENSRLVAREEATPSALMRQDAMELRAAVE